MQITKTQMSFIEDSKKKMFTTGADRFSEERMQEARPQVVPQETAGQTTDVNPPILKDLEAEARKRTRNIFIGIGICVAVLVVAGGTFWGISAYRSAHTVDPKQINVSIKAPQAVLSGDDAEFVIIIKNDSKVIWNNAVLEAKAPDGLYIKKMEPMPSSTTTSLQWGIGILRPKESTSFKVVGRLVGKPESSSTFTTLVSFNPENAPTKKETKQEFVAVRVGASPVEIALEAPKQAANGDRVKIRIVYQNHKAVDVTDIRINLIAPTGFAPDQTIPPAKGSGLSWDFPIITQQANGEIIVTGTVQGDPDVVRPFKAEIGFMSGGKFITQSDVQATTVMARQALTITQVFNDAQDKLRANPSDKVTGKIVVKNTGNIGLRGLKVVTTITGTGINQATMETAGAYDSRTNVLTWTPASITSLNALRPGDYAEIPLRFEMLPATSLPARTAEDKNFAVDFLTQADSPDIPTPVGATKIISSGKFQIMVNSVLSLETAAFYDDGRAGLPVSTGPMPPQVGQETTYTIRVRVKNTSNDVVEGLYRTILPEGLRWVNNKYTTTGQVTFDERTREIKWQIGIVSARAGTAMPGPELAFQVGLTPSLNQIQTKPNLLLGASFDATDTFTGSKLRATADVINTENVDPLKSEVVR